MLIKIQKNISLSSYTSFKIGGLAKYFCVAENIAETKEALKFAFENKLNIFILGGGSNILVSDEGFDGLIIRITNYELRITNNKIFVGAGLPLAKIINESIKNNLAGMEWATGIPGTVGGAVHNNAGASGICMADVVENIEIFDIGYLILGNFSSHFLQKGNKITSHLKNEAGKILKLNNKQCQFSYRNSIFKKEKKFIILSAVLKLRKENQRESKKMILDILKLRKEKQPLEYPSAGSVFKNPVVDDKHLAKIIKKYPELKNIVKNNIIPTGWLIEEVGLKNKKIGGAMVSEKHCNFIVNFNNARAEDVIILISIIKQKIRNNFGIQLKEEIEYVGF